MVERFKQGKLIWINLKNPSTIEVQKAMVELNLPPLLMGDLTTTVPRNSAIKVEDTIKITLDFPVVKQLNIDHQYEVKFLISKKSLLTVQYEEMEGIDRFKRQFEVATTLRKTQKNITGTHLFVSLFNNLYDTTSSKLDYIESKLADIESQIFENNEKQMVYEISNVSKKLIAFRHTIHGHEDIFEEMKSLFADMHGKVFETDFESIQAQYFALQRKANTQYETLAALRETNAAMLTTKQNEVIKTLTIMAFITFPLTLFSSMFGMNTEATPIIGHKADFWIIVSIMVAVTISFFTFFRRKKWL
jgi:magnesium transporter